MGHWREKHQGLEFLYVCVGMRVQFSEAESGQEPALLKSPICFFQLLPTAAWSLLVANVQSHLSSTKLPKIIKAQWSPTPHTSQLENCFEESDKHIHAYNSPERIMYFLHALTKQTTV